MTIASQVNKVLYSGTGETVYPYTFKIFKDTDLVVLRRAANGTEITLTLNTGYEVEGAGNDTGGTVTLIGAQALFPPGTGEKLLIKRVIPLIQSTDWVENDDFPAQVIEDAVDRSVCIAQQQQEQIDRCLKVGETSSLSGTIDPDQIAANATAAAENAQASAQSAQAAAASAVSAANQLSGWVSPGFTGLTYISANSFSVSGDQTAILTPGGSSGRALMAAISGANTYGLHVKTATYSGGVTTVTTYEQGLASGLSAIFLGQDPRNAVMLPSVLRDSFANLTGSHGVCDIINHTGSYTGFHSPEFTSSLLWNATALGVMNDSGTFQWNITSGVFSGTATRAKYADLAEIYTCEAAALPVGTLVQAGRSGAEVDVCEEGARVVGVVSEKPACLMNSGSPGIVVGLTGKIPVRIVGKIAQGDEICPAGSGVGRAVDPESLADVIRSFGSAFESSDVDGEKLVMCAIK